MSEDNGIITLSKDINMKEFLKSRLNRLVLKIAGVLILIGTVHHHLTKPGPPYKPKLEKSNACLSDPEFMNEVRKAHYIPTRQERPDLYLKGED
jgi:hypothetical protein